METFETGSAMKLKYPLVYLVLGLSLLFGSSVGVYELQSPDGEVFVNLYMKDGQLKFDAFDREGSLFSQTLNTGNHQDANLSVVEKCKSAGQKELTLFIQSGEDLTSYDLRLSNDHLAYRKVSHGAGLNHLTGLGDSHWQTFPFHSPNDVAELIQQ